MLIMNPSSVSQGYSRSLKVNLSFAVFLPVVITLVKTASFLEQVVSFKWLAYHFEVPASLAKQILFTFLEQHSKEVSATYLLAGWTKDDTTRHVVQLVGTKALQEQRSCLTSETSLHVYSIQPSQPKVCLLTSRCISASKQRSRRSSAMLAKMKTDSCFVWVQDPAELWNNDFLQSKQLLDALVQHRVANVLANNSASAISCAEAKWDPAISSRPPAKAPDKASQPPASMQAAAMKTAVDNIVSGMHLNMITSTVTLGSAW